MTLFNEYRASNNILTKDCIANYYGKILSSEEANQYFDLLIQISQWENDDLVFFGKRVTTKRKVAWHGDSEYLYTYSSTKFNSCLLNLYNNGNEGMGWHSDDEKPLGKNSTIASLSFGAERKFSFKHKQTKQTVSVVLEPGSLLVMKDATQSNWLHSLPKSKNITQPRINLTFRTIHESQ
jgi:alkylated DNA repair dioxygenase AlkB